MVIVRTRAAVAGVLACAVVVAGAAVAVARLAGSHGRSVRVTVSAQRGGSVTLGGASLSVPAGVVSGSGYLVASTGGASPAAGGRGSGLALAEAAAPVHFQVTGAHPTGTLRVTFRVGAIRLPRSVPASARRNAVWLAYYDPAARRWQPVASRYDPATGTVTAQVRHLSWWAPWTWDWQGFSLRLRQALSAFGSGRAPAESCPGVLKVTAASAGGQDPPLIGCAASRSGGKLTVSVTNNRGISAVMSEVPPDATQDPAAYKGFYEYVASRDAVTRALGGADLPPSATLTYSLPLSGPPTAFTAVPTVPSYVLDLASAAGEALLGEAKFGKVSGAYATCVLNAVAHSEPASFSDAPQLALQCLPALEKTVPALSGLACPVLELVQQDARLLLQDFDLAHDDISGVSGKVTITRPAPVIRLPPTDFTVCVLPVVDCHGEMKTEPGIVTLSADGSVFLGGITWSSWGAATAQGSGTLNTNNCQPSCAQGTFSRYPATITLTRLTPYGNGLKAYASITVTSPPDSYDQTFSINLVP